MNRLADEKSPYLLQHKDNPVNWYPWGEEALNKAKEENKPLFISIGYSTCHWCHVMNRESFNDVEVAKVLNEYFVPIKVDREERPDIDKVYMSFSEAMTGQGGWPLNVFATPLGSPFYVGTYFPKKSRYNMIGIIELSNKLNEFWIKDEEKIIDESNNVLKEVKKIYEKYDTGDIEDNIDLESNSILNKIFDPKNGGFGTKPKFPMPQYLLFLLEYAEKSGNKRSLEIAEITLEKMYKGGIFDHIGYGFFRYSVDEKWLVPHFEKMLYDNALLSLVYTKAYELTDKELYKNVANKIYEFILRDMTSDTNGFYSAIDADSEGVEGKYYVFGYDEINNLLGPDLGAVYTTNYDITPEGNFESLNIPNLIGKKSNTLDANMDSIRQMLFNFREKRIPPHTDKKIMTSWNGLMIASLSNAGAVFKNSLYIKKAKEAADFILNYSTDTDGNLLSTYINGDSYNQGFLEDYSFFVFGILNLYKVTKEEVYLEKAKSLTEDMLELFGEENHKGLFFYNHNSEKLVLDPKDIYDGVIPSGNSMALINLLSLYNITGECEYAAAAKEIFYSFGGELNKNPLAHLYAVMAYKNLI
ncbi:MAG: thioredoxin domain-containing protein [Synergistaceae bacterium]|nr:thioredoxin domain-containing protein [Synergistaceae bacterium]